MSPVDVPAHVLPSTSNLTPSFRHLVITVHGIRTYGRWQERLEALLKQAETGIKISNYKYGYFSVLAFLVPFLRWITTRDFGADLEKQLHREAWDRVDIVAHSFGTHLVAWALYKMRNKDIKINTIILSGSVLKSRFPWRDLLGKTVQRVVNDCGANDLVLVANQLLVLLTGMAGRIGFDGMTNDSFRNRYHHFGHSGYFCAIGTSHEDEFMKVHWLPLLLTSAPIPFYPDPRAPGFIRDTLRFFAKNAEPIKLILYVTPPLLALSWVMAQNRALEQTLANLQVAKDQTQLALTNEANARKQETLARMRAEKNEKLAIEAKENETNQRKTAESQRQAALVSLSEKLMHDQYDLGLLLGVEALRMADTAIARNNLRLAMDRHPYLRQFLFAHTNEVHALAYTPDGRILASGAKDGSIILWDTSSWSQLRSMKDDRGAVNGLAFSPDGALASAGGDLYEQVFLWDIRTGEKTASTGNFPKFSYKLSFSPDGNVLAYAQDGNIILWDVQTHQLIASLEGIGDSGMSNVAFSPDGRLLACGFFNGTVAIWDTKTLKIQTKLEGQQRRHINVVRFSPDGKYLASGSSDKTVILWSLIENQQPAALTGHREEITDLAFSPDGKMLASASWEDPIFLWNVATPPHEKERELTGHSGAITSIVFSPDGKSIVASTKNNSIAIWNAEDRPRLLANTFEEKGQPHGSNNIIFTRDGNTIVRGDLEDGSIVFQDIANPDKREILTSHTARVTSLAISHDGKMLATAAQDESVVLWDTITRRSVARLAGASSWPYAVTFSVDTRRVAAAGPDNEISVWDTDSKQQIGSLLGHRDAVTSISYSPNGRILASGSWDKSVILWDAKTLKSVGILRGHQDRVQQVLFSADGKLVASAGDDKKVILWDIATKKQVAMLDGHSSEVQTLTLCPNQDTLVSAGSDDKMFFWNLNTRRLIGTITKGWYKAIALACSPDGRMLASSMGNGPIKLWKVDNDLLKARACAIANRNLSDEEWLAYIGPGRPSTVCTTHTGQRHRPL